MRRRVTVNLTDVPDLDNPGTCPHAVERALRRVPEPSDGLTASATSKFDRMVSDGLLSDGATVPTGFSYEELNALMLEGRICLDDNRFVAVADAPASVEKPVEAGPIRADAGTEGARLPRTDLATPGMTARVDPIPAKQFGIWKKGKQGAVRYVRCEMIRYLINLGITADDNGTFHCWDGIVYRRIDESEVRNDVYDALEGTDVELSTGEMGSTMMQLASNARFSHRAVPDAFYAMSTYDGEIAAFANGWYNITQDEWVRPTPNIFLTRQYSATYRPSVTSHPVADVVKGIIPDDDTRRFFYEMCGYIMFSQELTVPAIFVIYGPGNTGKTALQTALTHALGEENVSHLDMGQLCGRFTLSDIEGRILNVCGETGSAMVNGSTVADGELLKKLAEGQTVLVDRKHSQPRPLTNTAKLLFVSNSVPNFGDTSSGLYRRLYIIPCRVEQDWDSQIYGTLCDEDAQSYLVNQFLQGYLRFEARGRRFAPSAEMQDELVRFKTQESMMDYLEAFFGTTDRAEVARALNGQYAQDVYREYRSYMAETGGNPLSQRRFDEKLRNEFGVVGHYVHTTRQMPDGTVRTTLKLYSIGGASDERRRRTLFADVLGRLAPLRRRAGGRGAVLGGLGVRPGRTR